MKQAIKGYVPPRKILKTPLEIMDDKISTLNSKIETIDHNVTSLSDEIKKKDTELVYEVDTEKIKQEILAEIEIPDAITGKPGKDAEPVDTEEIVQEVISRLPEPVNAQSIVEEVLSKLPLPQEIIPLDEAKLLSKFLKQIPNKKGDLKIIQENVAADPLSVIEKIMALPEGAFKLKTTHIDGLEQTIRAFHSQLGRGYLHGGGISNITGLIHAGTNITITGSGTQTSPYVISATGATGEAAPPLHAIQFNNPLGNFAGSASLTWNDTTKVLQVGDAPIFPTNGGFGFTYDYVASIGRNITNPLSVVTTSPYTPLLIAPTITQNTSAPNAEIIGLGVDITLQGTGDLADGVQGNYINVTYLGSGHLGAIAGGQMNATMNSGHTDIQWGAIIGNVNMGTATADTMFGLEIYSEIRGSATVVTNAGIWVDDITGGSLDNFAIKTNQGVNQFGDDPDGSPYGDTYVFQNSMGLNGTNLLVNGKYYAELLIANTLTQNVNSSTGHLSFAVDNTITGSGNISFIQGGYFGTGYTGTGTIIGGIIGNQTAYLLGPNATSTGGAYGIFVQNDMQGTVTGGVYGVWIDSSMDGGTADAQYGLYVVPQSGATNNFDIWSGTDLASTYDPFGIIPGAQNVFSNTGDYSAFSVPAKVGILSVVTNTGTVGSIIATQYVAQTHGTGGGDLLTGTGGFVLHHGSGTVGYSVGVDTYTEVAHGGGTITTAQNLQAGGFLASNGGVITTAYGVHVYAGGADTGGSIGTNIGVYIEPHISATENHNIWSGNLTVPLDPFGYTQITRNVFHTDTATSEGSNYTTLNLTTVGNDVTASAYSFLNAVSIVTNNSNANYFIGGEFDIYHHGTGTIGNTQNVAGYMQIDNGGTVTNADNFVAGSWDVDGTGSKITNYVGFRFYANNINSGGAITNQWGIKIGDITNGSTINRAIETGLGSILFGDKITKYNAVSTTGWGVPAIYGSGRFTAQTAAKASVATYTVGAADGSFLVSANVNVTAFTLGTFNVTCAYTDETNTAQTLKLNFSSVTGTIGIALAAAGPFEGIPAHIRCKAGTAITIATSGTFTTLTYNVEANIYQTN